jgi:hypothetical protein
MVYERTAERNLLAQDLRVRPVTARAVSITSLTEKPLPVPRLSRRANVSLESLEGKYMCFRKYMRSRKIGDKPRTLGKRANARYLSGSFDPSDSGDVYRSKSG